MRVRYIKPSMGKAQKSRLRVSNGKIKPPKGRVKFLAAENLSYLNHVDVPGDMADVSHTRVRAHDEAVNGQFAKNQTSRFERENQVS